MRSSGAKSKAVTVELGTAEQKTPKMTVSGPANEYV